MSHQTQMGFFQEIPGIHQECAQMGRHKRFKKDMKQKNRKGRVTTTATLEAVRRVWFLPLREEGLFAAWAAASLLLLHFGGGWQGLWKRLPCAIQGCGERRVAEGSRCLCPAQGRRLRSRRAIAASRPPGNPRCQPPPAQSPLPQAASNNKKENVGLLNASEVATLSSASREMQCSQPTGLQTWSRSCSWRCSWVWWSLPTVAKHSTPLRGTSCSRPAQTQPPHSPVPSTRWGLIQQQLTAMPVSAAPASPLSSAATHGLSRGPQIPLSPPGTKCPPQPSLCFGTF